MKIFGTLLIALFLSCNLAFAQDTLYVYRSGQVVNKLVIAGIDSVTFFKNCNIPTLETFTDQDGNLYHKVKIGTQTWMAENLKSVKYRNGESIQNLPLASDWSNTTGGAWCDYNNVAANGTKYGKIYNWYAVSDIRMIAPVGWHVATDVEWTILTNFLGGTDVAGGKLKENGTLNWASPNLGATNETKFSALPGGERGNNDGTFDVLGTGGFWWTSTILDNTYSWFRSIGYSSAGVGRSGSARVNGLFVRCVKDTLPVVSTTLPGSILNTSATTGGNIIGDGGAVVTSRGVCWSTSEHPTIANSKTTDGTGIGTFTSSITGLMADSTYYVRAYASNSAGTAYGNQVSFKTLNVSIPTVTDVDGNVYHMVTIGTQTWMVENLKTTKLKDGTVIPKVTEKAYWGNLTTPGYCWYNNDSITYKNTTGAIYNWYTVNTGKLAPAGWHIPSDTDWTTLTDYLGSSLAGGKLKETGFLHWTSPNTGATNETGFTALPGGNRGNNDGTFDAIGTGCFWWTSTQQDFTYSFFRSVGYNGTGIGRSGSKRVNGMSVRCIKD